MNHSSFMRRNGYKYLTLRLNTYGNYSARDSEWNYSDIPHLNYIHTKVEGFTFYASDQRIINQFMQRFGPFSVPVSNYIEHLNKNEHFYVMNILGMVISINTTHNEKERLKAITTTEYKFYYRNIFEKLFAYIIKFSTKKNYKILMSEDKPMRNQRGFLRSKGISFRNDNNNRPIGFSETEDLSIINVDGREYFKLKEKTIINLNMRNNSKHINELFITVVEFENKLALLGDICQHEGANLTYEFDNKHEKCKSACPWHGKLISPLLVINKNDMNKYTFSYLNQKFNARIIDKTLQINTLKV